MICLYDRLHEGTTIQSDSRALDYLALRSLASQLRAKHPHLAGRAVAIHGLPFHAIGCLLALDGWASDVVLVPTGACRQFIERVLAAVPLAAVLTDSSVEACTWPAELVGVNSQASQVEEASDRPVQKTRWLIATSGTTSTPKLVAHTLDTLTRSISAKRRHSGAIWGLLYDPARFAGLQVVLQVLMGGGTLVAPDLRLALSERLSLFLRHGVNALSATPTLWRKLLMTPGGTGLALQQITLGGEITDERTIKALAQTYPKAHITHIYASTEAGVGFAVHDGYPGFPAAWLNVEGQDMKLCISEASTLLIRPALRDQAYVGAQQVLFDEGGWLDTGDLVECRADRVVFKGRANGSINVGGNKVMPEEVEAHIQQLDFITAAMVRPKASSLAGALLEALVVLKNDAPVMQEAVAAIKKHCRDQLAAYKVPAFVKVVDQLPMTAAGKLARGG